MKTVIHDLGKDQNEKLLASADRVVHADGRYAPCQGCFKCWTKHPVACAMKDELHQACRVLGTADDLTIITENLYGSYSPAVKNILDRSIATSTPLSTYRSGQMHHTLRYMCTICGHRFDRNVMSCPYCGVRFNATRTDDRDYIEEEDEEDWLDEMEEEGW